MKCRKCGAATEVVETRMTRGVVKRKRRCFNGVHVFVTYEVLPGAVSWKDVRPAPPLKDNAYYRAKYVASHSYMSNTALARELNITEARVRQIRKGLK